MTTYQAKFNREALQWDVVDQDGEIVAMFGGGSRGRLQAQRSAARMMVLEHGAACRCAHCSFSPLFIAE
jgi:hypothetical protein